MSGPRPAGRAVLGLYAALVVLGAWSAIDPHDLGTWVAETLPAWAGIALLWATRRRFPLTTLSYVLLAVFAAVLFVGGHYTYSEVPFGHRLREWLDLERNPYDRLGHFLQGLAPGLVAREVLLRRTPLRRGGWLFFLVACVALAISAAYELVEWAFAVVFGGDRAEDFLGAQGDPWDAQWDMFLALLAAVLGQLALGRLQDRQIEGADPVRARAT